MKNKLLSLMVVFLFSCGEEVETVKPLKKNISESIYASGIITSKNQYQLYARVPGIIDQVFVEEGDTVLAGTPILSIYNENQRLSQENAQLSARYYDYNANQEKLIEAKKLIELSREKMLNDSMNYYRQKLLNKQDINALIDLEQSELAYNNSKIAFYSSKVKYEDLRRMLEYNSLQAKKNLQISGNLSKDYTVFSEIDGIVYRLNKTEGEMINTQTELAVIGDANRFILEMQIDENDILKIRIGLPVIVILDSYPEVEYEAIITKIKPMMDTRSKTFFLEAEFEDPPKILYPNMNFEANIVIQSKENALLIPRQFLINDSIVTKSNGDKVIVKTGLKDYEMIEILSGLSVDDEIIKSEE